jgi:hypothetical protein
MTHRQHHDDDYDRDPEEPEDFDRDDDPDGTDTEPCPHCNREIHADTDICPHCGSFVLHDEDNPPSQRAIWIIAAIALLLAMAFMILAHGGF